MIDRVIAGLTVVAITGLIFLGTVLMAEPTPYCETLPPVDARSFDTTDDVVEVLHEVGFTMGCAPVDNGDGSFSWRVD